MVRQLNGRKIDDYGQVILEESGLCDILMRGGSISGLCAEENENTLNFNDVCRQFGQTEENLVFCKSPDISIEDFNFITKTK